MISTAAVAASPKTNPLEQRVRAELLRTAYADSIYGAPFAMVIAVMVGGTMLTAFPPSKVIPWVLLMLGCNLLRLLSRWRYTRRPVPLEATGWWERAFVFVSAITGLCVGWGMWMFYGANDPIYRVMVVLVLAGLTTGASRLLAPVYWANVSYLYLSVAPLLPRFVIGADLRGYALAVMCLIYLGYMTVAARQQLRTLRRLVALGFENTTLVGSLGSAKDATDQLNRELTAEIERRNIVETELRAARERAEAASRAKSEFLATMSHEIRTPMNGLLGMLRIVRDSELTTDQRDHLETAAGSADALLELIKDILDFSKIEAGRLELERIAFDPTATIKTVVDLLGSRAKAKGLELAIDLDPHLPVGLLGDPTRLRQVLFNLVGNAIKFTERGRVALSVKCEAVEATSVTLGFAVTDTGIGMDAEALGRLFTVFMQADSTMSRRFGGTGLGLAISQRLVEAMGGKIGAESKPGSGSSFYFRLRFQRPVTIDPKHPTREVEAPYVPPALRGRVLVVEDDRVNQRVIGHFLKQMGLEITTVDDGFAAVKAATSAEWDAVLMDCQLPGLDGLEATRRIRAQLGDRKLPIIALTANASTSDRTACLAAGMDDFLTKPVRRELLAAALGKRLPAAAPARSPDQT